MNRKKILVVDDEPRVLETVEFRLRLSNYDVITAISGKEAIEKAENEAPDLILLDILMPDMDGFATCAQLKNNEKTKSIPIIMFTAKSDVKDVTKAFNNGAQDYVVKPYDPQILIKKMKQELN